MNQVIFKHKMLEQEFPYDPLWYLEKLLEVGDLYESSTVIKHKILEPELPYDPL